MPKSIFFLSMLALLATPLVSAGEAVDYRIDLAGLSQEHGHRLRAFGTITLDLTLSTREAVLGSNLMFQHEMDAPIPLKPQPDNFVDPSDGLQWQAVGDALYINRISTLNRTVHWSSVVVPDRVTNFFFEAGPPNNPHGLFFRLGAHDDTVLLKPGGGPDGPQGFFVGTKVPEPSSLKCAIGGFVVCVMRSKKASRARPVR